LRNHEEKSVMSEKISDAMKGRKIGAHNDYSEMIKDRKRRAEVSHHIPDFKIRMLIREIDVSAHHLA
jgi:hypothetical protein